MKNINNFFIVSGIAIIFTWSSLLMAGFFSSSLSSDWQARLSDVKVFNNYTKDYQVKLADVEIKGYDLTGMDMPKGIFNGTRWKNIKARNSYWGKVTIKGGQFQAVDFTGSQFDHVVFEDVTFINVQFDESQLRHVQFINADIKQTDFWRIKNSIVLFDRSKLKENNIGDSQANLSFKGSELFDSDLRGMTSPSSLSFDGSQLEEVSLSYSTLEKLSINDSKVHETAIKKAKVDKIEFINTALHISLTGSIIKELLVAGSDLQLLTINHAELPKVRIQHCKKVESMDFYESKIGTLSINNCPLNNFRLRSAQIENLVLENSSLENSKFEEMKAGNVTFRKVELKGTLNFTGATIEKLKTEGLTKAPGLKLITEGGNVKF